MEDGTHSKTDHVMGGVNYRILFDHMIADDKFLVILDLVQPPELFNRAYLRNGTWLALCVCP